ncbi:hypothetical protein AGABI2DRAFT_201549 [Agaricus bisporus var. bisporus H97]|uniref:hypothetical protein n=1 Tax=Agaricus bisporus var. bisporus (strain H97 / ATCC MYA-4626 / FGSC 10389) TaxID=936046 RepID=UPI00029F7092|nr:hypothetical protein AGABI2DRAFT_201549 [Agaricus bisporus var. bisporus H97]EKV49295.1 hypothetical protein AGABI2DRAFT_201549 [Agaricus bisporus var. bisporus H97]
MTSWNIDFLKPLDANEEAEGEFALVILNQPFSFELLDRVWRSAKWRCCADGGANRLYDVLKNMNVDCRKYLPDLIKGDLDSLREDVKHYYESQNIDIVRDTDQDSTDLMKCVQTLESKEQEKQYDIIILGGLSGRLDQTIHTLSYLHKLRKKRKRVYAVTDDNIGWVLDSGEHDIQIDHTLLGPTCGLLPVGIDETLLSFTGLRWNLTECRSGFEGMVSTSNQLVPGEDVVWVKTTRPIWWTVELRPL